MIQKLNSLFEMIILVDKMLFCRKTAKLYIHYTDEL